MQERNQNENIFYKNRKNTPSEQGSNGVFFWIDVRKNGVYWVPRATHRSLYRVRISVGSTR